MGVRSIKRVQDPAGCPEYFHYRGLSAPQRSTLLSARMPPTLALLLLALSLSAAQGSGLCHLTNATISAEKDDCPLCVTFTTSICSGYCHTKELVYKHALSTNSQKVCTYKEIRYDTIKLPNCPPGVDPFFTYPVAISCDCNMCKMDYSDCTVQSIGPEFCSASRGFL